MTQRYARMAEEHWKAHLPDQYAALTNPAEFFLRLGEEAAEQVEELTESLMEKPEPGETFAQTASRMAQARHAAEATVTREFLLPAPPETPTEPSPEDEELATAVSDFDRLADELRETLDSERAAKVPPPTEAPTP